jgi:hypothetical protein
VAASYHGALFNFYFYLGTHKKIQPSVNSSLPWSQKIQPNTKTYNKFTTRRDIERERETLRRERKERKW